MKYEVGIDIEVRIVHPDSGEGVCEMGTVSICPEKAISLVSIGFLAKDFGEIALDEVKNKIIKLSLEAAEEMGKRLIRDGESIQKGEDIVHENKVDDEYESRRNEINSYIQENF